MIFNKKNKETESCIFCGHVKEVKHDIICQIKSGIEDFLSKNHGPFGKDITVEYVDMREGGNYCNVILVHKKYQASVELNMPIFTYKNNYNQKYLNDYLESKIPIFIDDIFKKLMIAADENKELNSKLDKIKELVNE